jgi:hypothetical protein
MLTWIPFSATAEPDYVWASQGNGLAQFEEDGQIGLINQDGEIVCPPIYEGMSYFDEFGFAEVYQFGADTTEIKAIGIINEQGELVIPFDAYWSLTFIPPDADGRQGLFRLHYGNFSKLLNESGNEISDKLWYGCIRSGNGIFVTEDGNTWYLIDETGSVISDYSFFNVEEVVVPQTRIQRGYRYTYSPLSHHVGHAITDTGYVVVNDEGKIIKEYERVSNDDAVLIAMYDEKGEKIFGNEYDDVTFDTEYSLYHVVKDGLHGIISESKELLIPLEYEEIRIIPIGSEYHFLCSRNGKETLLNSTGETVIPLVWDRLFPKDGYIRVTTNGKMGVVGVSGTVIIEPIWDYITSMHDYIWVHQQQPRSLGSYGWRAAQEQLTLDWYYVFKDEKMGVVSTSDEVLLEPIWEKIIPWETNENGELTFYVEGDDTGFIVSMNGEVFEKTKNRYWLPEWSEDESIRLAEEIDSNGKALSWTLFDNRTNEILWKLGLEDGFSLPYLEGASSPDYIDDVKNVIKNIQYDDEIGFIDRSGTMITNKDWLIIWSGFSDNGLAFVETKDRKFGIIDLKGNYVCPPILDTYAIDTQGKQSFFRQGDEWYARIGERHQNGNLTYGYINGEGLLICGFKMPE